MAVGHISCLHLQSDQKGDEGGIGNVSLPLESGSVVVRGHGHALIQRGVKVLFTRREGLWRLTTFTCA